MSGPGDAPQHGKPRLLVLVVAYYAESTLRQVLKRIPRCVFEDYDCEVLVVDDASEDRTFAIGRECMEERPDAPITVLRNEYGQGYGGSQKVGYAYAIDSRFDVVALLRGDWQCAPEELPRLLEPLRSGQADAVLGRRTKRRVRYRVLTSLENRLLGTRFSDLHCGYRAYSVRALESVPYRLNSDGVLFDTEIIIQLVNAEARIREVSIPASCGREVRPAKGTSFAKDVLLTCIRNVFHRAGLLYQRRFDPHPVANRHYDLKLGYASSHTYALEAVRAGARVLDLGAGPGGLARELVRKGCEVAVVDLHAPAEQVPGVQVFVADLDEPLEMDLSSYDTILLLDIIEHLRDPERFLDRLRAQFDHRPRRLVLTTGNVAFIVQRLMLLLGQFNYGEAGILDRTHTRLFTFRATRHLLRDAGFRIRRIRGIPAPFPKVFGGIAGRALVAVNRALIAVSKSLFAYQIYVEAESTPDVDFVVRDTKRMSAVRAAAPDERNPTAEQDISRVQRRTSG